MRKRGNPAVPQAKRLYAGIALPLAERTNRAARGKIPGVNVHTTAVRGGWTA